MAISNTVDPSGVGLPNLESAARQNIDLWSSICQTFLEWQRQHMLLREPTPQEMEEHRHALEMLLRATRLVYSLASDPSFRDRSMAKELRGRSWQLERSWGMFYDAMPQQEASKLLAEVFPDAPRSHCVGS